MNAPTATMKLIEFDAKRRILAGHDAAGESVWVLRKDDQGDYGLFRIEISELDQALRSFITADESERLELVKAITETMEPPKRKRRSKAR